MFFGVVPRAVTGLIVRAVAEWNPSQLYVGCSGNFTIERAIFSEFPEIQQHGNDVHLYPTAIGKWMSGTDPDLVFSDVGRELYEFITDEHTDTPEGRLACMLMISTMCVTLDAECNEKANPYFERLRAGYRHQWPRLWAETNEKIEASETRLASYTRGDVMQWIDEVPKDVPFLAYPPFSNAMANYSPENPKLETIYEWEDEPFTDLSDENLEELYDKIADRPQWMFGLNLRVPRFDDYLIGRHKTTNRGTLMYVYGDTSEKLLVTPTQAVSPLMIPHLSADEDLGEKLELKHISYAQFAHLRSMYMNANIRPGAASVSLAVLVDGVLIGCVAFNVGREHPSNWAADLPAPHAYMLSDFPVAGSKYNKISRLIAAAATSKEAQLICEGYANRRYRAITTTAFSNQPTSMKYRGTFKLLRRRNNADFDPAWRENSELRADDSYYSRKFDLEYGTEFGVRTLDEIMKEWSDKHRGDVRHEHEDR